MQQRRRATAPRPPSWSRSRIRPCAPSNLAIIGRYVLTPKIFEKLEATQRGAGGEIQLTDAIEALMAEQDVYAYAFEGRRYDAGTTMGWLKASVELALERPDIGAEFRHYLVRAGSELSVGYRPHGTGSRCRVNGRAGEVLAEVGQVLAGRYRLVELLGHGGHGDHLPRA